MSRPLALAAGFAALLILSLVLFFSLSSEDRGSLEPKAQERELLARPLEAPDAPGAEGTATVARAEQATEPEPTPAAPVFTIVGALRDHAGKGVPAGVQVYLAESAPRVGVTKPSPAEIFGALVEGLDVDAYAALAVEPPQIYLATGISDAEGRFALGLSAHPERPLFLWVVDPIWTATEAPRLGVPPTTLKEARIEVAVHAGASLSGRVVDATGRGLDGAEVLLRDLPTLRPPNGMNPDSFPPPYRSVRSDAEGRFSFAAVLPYERYQLRAAHGTAAQRLVGLSETVELRAEQRAEIVLQLRAGKSLRGRVQNEKGEPIADAEVLAIPGQSAFASMETNTDPTSASTRSAADGSFALQGLLPIRYLVLAEARGCEPSRPARADLEAEASTEVVLVLNAGFDLRGLVLDEEKQPVGGAEIVLLRTFSQNTFTTSTGRPLVPRRTTSDATGRFTFFGLEDGSFELQATSADGLRSARKTGLRKKALEKEISLELAPLGVLEGTVIDSERAPVTRFKLELQRKVMMGFLPATVASGAFADPAGRFRLEGLAPGKYLLLVRVEGRATHTLPEVSVAAGAAPLEIALPAVSSISGLVVSASGQPIAGAEVSIAGDMLAAIAGEMSMSSWKAKSDASGRFQLGGLPVGELALRALHPQHAPSEALTLNLVAGSPLENVELRLGVGGAVEGTVYDGEGRPEAGTMVMANHGPLQIEQRQTETGADGRYRLEGLTPGQIGVIAMGLDQVNEADSVMSALRMQNVKIAGGQTLVVDFGEPPGAARGTRLFGTLTENGKAKKGAMILAACRGETPSEGEDTGRLRFANSDRNGAFEFKNLPPGPASLSVVQFQDGGQSVVEFDLVVLPQPEQRHDLSLDSGSLSGRVRTPSGEGLASVQVVLMAQGVTGNEGFRAFVISGEDGRYRFEGLAEGSYRATAGGPSFFGTAQNRSARSKDSLRVVAGKELADVDFELETGAILVGRLTDMHGKGVEGASIEARPVERDSGEKGFFQGLSGPDGRLRVVGVEPGLATVRITKRGYAPTEQPNVLFEAGQETRLELRIEEGVRLRVRVVDAQGAPLGNASGRVLDANGKLVDSLISFEDLIEFAQGGLGAGLLELGSFAAGSYRVRIEVEGREAQEMAVELKRSNDGIQEVLVRFP
ncbi:MAG: carboxypeptidase regulatory-like domain-containing protein [Planctomycetes bacterium]|nr:carboxypeptidase regulatory-like domain-containing protein [Planctomycetota bacterium]